MSHACTFVIFGATGNLARNKLLPALYHLEEAGRLPDGMNIIGMGRADMRDEDWRKRVVFHAELAPGSWRRTEGPRPPDAVPTRSLLPARLPVRRPWRR